MKLTDTATVPAVPFEIASQLSNRTSFSIATQTLSAAAPLPLTPIQIPAVGFLSGILLEVSLGSSGGTNPALQADAPWNVIQSINLRNAGGVNLIVPLTGYQLYLVNKYGGQVPGIGAWCDPKYGNQYITTNPVSGALGTAGHFFLWVPVNLDAETALGAIPALASNANYQIELTLAAQATVTTSNPTITVGITGTAWYYDVPPSNDVNGAPNATSPFAPNTFSMWQLEQPSVNPGNAFVQSNNVGNIVRTHILTVRNSSGARIDTNGIPATTDLYIDNNPRFSFPKAQWEYMMSRWNGLGAATKDVVNGLDTGVYVIPYHALLGSAVGDPANTRAQLLPTLTTTLLQFRGNDWGSAISKLEILTQIVTTDNVPNLFAK